jgi:anaerobic magnesium-protoporphyrin IX monomethyl ester cyclase
MKDLTLIQFLYRHDTVPMGGLYLAAGLKKHKVGFNFKIYCQHKFNVDLKKLYSFFSQTSRIIAVGCYSHMLPYVLAVLREVKNKQPDKIIILGGLGPSEVAEEILQHFSFVDFIIKGYSIDSLPGLTKKIYRNDNNFNGIEGLVYRKNQKIISNKYESMLSSRTINGVKPHLLLKNAGSRKVFEILTSSGCVYNCTFCKLSSLSENKVIFRDTSKIIEEIEFLKKARKNHKVIINILDESFFFRRERVIQFCALLKKKKLDLTWSCYGRVDKMDADMLKIMSESGCRQIYYGIESGSNRILKEIKKGFTIEEAVKVLLISHKIIKRTIASFIYLYPFEEPKDFLETLYYMAYLKAKGIMVQLHPLNPVRNSSIYCRYKKDLFLSGRIPSDFRIRLTRMPKDCRRLVIENPEIFYFYRNYRFKHLDDLLKLSKKIIKLPDLSVSKEFTTKTRLL